ncbi:hypothetical protein HMPREF9088_1460 [Enterococcus italicus DSM 15952]|uniref:Uncharacterized protein n=1 Tax=Enterococcus italicus (strain DSM 15952 / CCUG 50447 / LMG 22039 / TP 1.5) TaxID=888064 RepID=E6LGH0_ENTI1|nr:hypothetical protein HMPREF9088_1460 [Enterococcus italicus DSM 15952]
MIRHSLVTLLFYSVIVEQDDGADKSIFRKFRRKKESFVKALIPWLLQEKTF